MISRFVGPFPQYLVSHYMADPQNDMLMWLMSETQNAEVYVEGLARRMLLTNFSSIHATSSASDAIPSLHMVEC